MASATVKRARKQPLQQELFRRGGKRRGAGRKPRGPRAGQRHEARPEFKSYHGLHVVMRVVPFQISAARHINTALGDGQRRRRGKVFADRYHLEVIVSPTRARHAIAYVLNNWRKHAEDRGVRSSTWLVDPFSTGILFPGWSELQDRSWMWPIRATYDPLVVFRPRTWLLSEGWKLAGSSISARDVPGIHGDARRASRIGCSSAATEARGRLRHPSDRRERGMYMATRGV